MKLLVNGSSLSRSTLLLGEKKTFAHHRNFDSNTFKNRSVFLLFHSTCFLFSQTATKLRYTNNMFIIKYNQYKNG